MNNFDHVSTCCKLPNVQNIFVQSSQHFKLPHYKTTVMGEGLMQDVAVSLKESNLLRT